MAKKNPNKSIIKKIHNIYIMFYCVCVYYVYIFTNFLLHSTIYLLSPVRIVYNLL